MRIRLVAGQVGQAHRVDVHRVNLGQRRRQRHRPIGAVSGRVFGGAMVSTTSPSTTPSAPVGTSVPGSCHAQSSGAAHRWPASATMIRASRATSCAGGHQLPERRQAQDPALIGRVPDLVGQVGLAQPDRSPQWSGERDPRVGQTSAPPLPGRSRRRAAQAFSLPRAETGGRRRARWPPSMTIVSPVIQLAASEARKTIAEATSPGSPIRPSG